MSIKVKIEDSSVWTAFKKSPDVLKTEWKNLGWGRRQQTRVKIGSTGDLHLQTIEQGFFKRLISKVFKTLTLGTVKSFGKNIVEHRSLGHQNAIKLQVDLTHKQRATLVARQQANLGMAYGVLKEKIALQIKELSELQEQYSPEMLAHQELSEIMDNLSKMEDSVSSEVSALGDPQERFSRLCLLEAQYHFFAKAKEEKLKQWQSGGRAIVKEMKIQKKELQRQHDELQERISFHLNLLMQKREECLSYPELYRQLSDLIAKSTEKQAVFFNNSDQESIGRFRQDIEELFSQDRQALEKIDRKKNSYDQESEALREKAFTSQVEGGKKLLAKHIDKLKEIAERYIPDSEPEREIRRMIELHLKSLNEKPSFKERGVNGFQQFVSNAILNDNKRLQEIIKFYSLPSPRKEGHAPNSKSEISLSPVWLIDDNPLPPLKTKEEAIKAKESILQDIKHILITMHGHSREASKGGYLAIDKEIRLIIKEFKKKVRDFQNFFQVQQNLQLLNLKIAEMNKELNAQLKRMAKIHQIISGDQILVPLRDDVSTRIHQFARRLPAAVLSDEDVMRIQEKTNELIKTDKENLVATEEQLSDIIQRQRQLISICYSVAEKYIRMKTDSLGAELLQANSDASIQSRKQFLFKLRDAEWKLLLQRGPACVTPHDLSQWSQQVFVQGTIDEVLIEELKKNSSGDTLQEIKDLVTAIGVEGEVSLPLPRQWENSLHDFATLKRKFNDLSGEKNLSLEKMKKLLNRAERKVQGWEKQNLISHEAVLKWSHACTLLQGKCHCVDLLLQFESSAIDRYLRFLEEQRKNYQQTGSSELVLKFADKLIQKIAFFVKWDPKAPLKVLDIQRNIWNRKLESVQKKFQLLQAIDASEKAYAKILKEATQMIAQWNEHCQFVNQQKIQTLLESQRQLLKEFEVKSYESMAAYEKALNIAKESLEDEIDLTKEMSEIEQLNLLPVDHPNMQHLQKAVIRKLHQRLETHLEELNFYESYLKDLWAASSPSLWHQQIFEQLTSKKEIILDLVKRLAVISETRTEIVEMESKIQQAIQSNLSELENQTYLNKIVHAKKRYDSFVTEIEKSIEGYRSRVQYSHAYRLNRILQKEKGVCESLQKDLSSPFKMQGYLNALEAAIVNVENVLKHISQVGSLSDFEQMKDLISKNPEDFERLHSHFRQEIENKIVNFHKELMEYQKRISAAIATIQCEISMEEQQKSNTASKTDKLLGMSEKLMELEVLQAKLLEKDSQLQRLKEKFPVWTYAVWMGKHPLDVAKLTPDQLRDYGVEVADFLEKTEMEVKTLVAPYLNILGVEDKS